MNIQDEMQKIHHKFGVSEMANYKIEQFIEDLIKKDRAEQLRIAVVVGQSEQLPDENLYKPCKGCTTSCKSWEVFFCKKLVG